MRQAPISLASGSTLSIKTGALSGTIDGSAAGNGTVIFNNHHTLANGVNIGATNAIAALSIASGVTLNATTNNNSINATNIFLDTGSILSVGSVLLEQLMV